MMAAEIQKQSALFGLSGVGVVEIDAQTGRLELVNATFCEPLGYSEAELRELKRAGLRYTELLHPDERGRLEAPGSGVPESETPGLKTPGPKAPGSAPERWLHQDGSALARASPHAPA